MTRRPLPDIVAQRPQPVINPMSLELEPDGPRKRALEVSHSRVLLGASLFAVVFVVIAVRLVAVTLLPDGAEAAMVPQAKQEPKPLKPKDEQAEADAMIDAILADMEKAQDQPSNNGGAQ